MAFLLVMKCASLQVCPAIRAVGTNRAEGWASPRLPSDFGMNRNAFKLLLSEPPKFSGLPTALGPSYHVVVEKSDGLNFHAKQIAHANVLILVDVEGGLIKATKMLEKSIYERNIRQSSNSH